tara:strand:+ start:928 stop:1062 length:135 start_codon:yes stop_codon:yes gene_type:complete
MFSRELSADDGNTLKLDFGDQEAGNIASNAESFYGRTLNRDQKI